MYHMGIYGDIEKEKWLRQEFKKAGKKLDMGKSCIRFKKLSDLPINVIGKAVSTLTPEGVISKYEKSRKR